MASHRCINRLALGGFLGMLNAMVARPSWYEVVDVESREGDAESFWDVIDTLGRL